VAPGTGYEGIVSRGIGLKRVVFGVLGLKFEEQKGRERGIGEGVRYCV
jgi:hypothetical protein